MTTQRNLSVVSWLGPAKADSNDGRAGSGRNPTGCGAAHAAAYAPAEGDTGEGQDERQPTQQPLDKLVYRGGGGVRDGGRGPHSSSLIARLKRQSKSRGCVRSTCCKSDLWGDPTQMNVRGPGDRGHQAMRSFWKRTKRRRRKLFAPLCALRKEQQLAMSQRPAQAFQTGLS